MGIKKSYNGERFFEYDKNGNIIKIKEVCACDCGNNDCAKEAQLQLEILKKDERIKELEKTIEKLKKENADLLRRNGEATAKANERFDIIQRLKDENKKLEAENISLNKIIEAQERLIKELEENEKRIAELEAENSNLRNTRTKIEIYNDTYENIAKK